MAMRIGTEMPALDGATEWLGTTQAHAEAEAKGHPRSFISGQSVVGSAKRICRELLNGGMNAGSKACA